MTTPLLTEKSRSGFASYRTDLLIAPAILLGLTLFMFCDVLLINVTVLGNQGTDLALQFLPWR